MTLPGVRTVIRDQFQTLSRSNLPDTVRVAVIGRRSNSETDYLDSEATPSEPVAPNFMPFIARTESQVVANFGPGSELHRAFLEAVSGGAPRVILVSWGSTDSGAADYADDAALNLDGPEDPFHLAFEAAEAVQADIIALWGRGGHTDPDPAYVGFHADMDGLLIRVADKCKEITDRSTPCFAVIGVSPLDGEAQPTTAELKAHIDALGLPDRQLVVPYATVVATELKPVGYPADQGWANGAATYAGFLASLQPEISATGKRLFNNRELRYAPTRTQQEDMVAKALTPIKQNFSREAVVVDAMTYSAPNSDYTRLSTLRIVFAAIELVRQAAENYVGFPATMHHRNAMDTAIGSQLRGMIVEGALIDADYNIAYTPTENTARIDLVLTPAFEMRNIEVSISIRL